MKEPGDPKESYYTLSVACMQAFYVTIPLTMILMAVAYFLNIPWAFLLAAFSAATCAMSFSLGNSYKRKFARSMNESGSEGQPSNEMIKQSVDKSRRQRLLRNQSVSQIGIGIFVIFTLHNLTGLIVGGALITIGLVLGYLFFRGRGTV